MCYILAGRAVPFTVFGISPNKLYEYMMSGVPILHAVEAANDPVREADCGLSVMPEDAAAISEGLIKLAALGVRERKKRAQTESVFVEERHIISRLAERFLAAV
jgi:glycosyltransferase involved in cell wall biosynthesis